MVQQVAREHPDAVAAHLGGAAIRVAVVHEPLGRRLPAAIQIVLRLAVAIADGRPRRRGGENDPQHAVPA